LPRIEQITDRGAEGIETFVQYPLLPAPANTSRPFQVHAETGYVLDCSIEAGDITPLEEMVFRVENAAAVALADFMDRGEMLPPHWLRNTARAYLDALPLEDRYVWALRALPSMQLGIRMLEMRMEFVVQVKVQSDLGIAPRTEVRFLDEGTPEMFSNRFFESVHDVTQVQVQQFLQSQYQSAWDRLETDLQCARDASVWAALPGNQERVRRRAQELFCMVHHAALTTQAHTGSRRGSASRVVALQRKAQRRARSAVKKAVRLFTRTGLEESVRLMVSGREVELSHPDSPFKFVLQPLQAGWLEQKTLVPGGHVPYQMTLLTKDEVFLSRLCVLFDQTPVLDQLLALTLFVESGSEAEILSKANWFGYESADAVRAILEEKAPSLLNKVPALRGPGENPYGLFGIPSATAHSDMHWAPYKAPVRNWIASWMSALYAALPQSARPADTQERVTAGV
jgi:hypothetical protein